MGQHTTYTRKVNKKETQEMPSSPHLLCSIPIPQPVTNYLSIKEFGNNFYEEINRDWISSVVVPPFENDYSVSEEVERCIYTKSVEILSNTDNKMLQTLRESCVKSVTQHTSVQYLQNILDSLLAIETPADIVKHFSALARSKIPSIFNYGYFINTDKHISLALNSNAPSLPYSLYGHENITTEYKHLLDKVGTLFGIESLSQIYEFERTLSIKLNSCWRNEDIPIKGGKLLAKYPRIPWAAWFEISGIEKWKKMKIVYNCPVWIRYLEKVLYEVPIHYWRLYLTKIYIFHALKYLPPPFDELEYEFFGRFLQGQKVKFPQMELYVNTVYSFMNTIYSKLFWKGAGEPSLCKPMELFAKTLVKSAMKRISEADWLEYGSRVAAIDKIKKMKIETVRPKKWPTVEEIELDKDNFLKNIHDLGAWNIYILLSRIGKQYNFWEEGIYRVNAFYFREANEINIPYGTIIAPFYSKNTSSAWNYGALGSIIGHEMCHGFDDDGKDYDANGDKKPWWSRRDIYHYKQKTNGLIELFNRQQIHNRHVNGTKTLSENIADLGGVAISLEALKMDMEARGVSGDAMLAEFRDFFQAFAVSWRTIYRKEKLDTSIDVDYHAPAFLRVNLVVSQFQEWYDAFAICESSELYIPPEKRIKIF